MDCVSPFISSPPLSEGDACVAHTDSFFFVYRAKYSNRNECFSGKLPVWVGVASMGAVDMLFIDSYSFWNECGTNAKTGIWNQVKGG
ncbi:MAG: hypothetical protein CVU39_20155 [Chloroflexi bacterium HGW-Chloroflexi-10]|nr:MAG: hypothetical protein CVU39_20155 [Chloroflexi bacterium HGW-Chloroflexi-10]